MRGVVKYVDDDEINVMDMLLHRSFVKKKQYSVKNAPILGTGFYGTVILATWKSPFYPYEKKEVALKIISKDPPNCIKNELPEFLVSRQGKSRERYRLQKRDARRSRDEAETNWRKAREIHKLRVHNEVAILREVNHENIVKFYDSFESGKNYYISTEVLYGEELFTVIPRPGYFTEARSRAATKAIMQGIDYLHRKGIVHMDLRPENIRLRTPGGVDDPVIVDMGYARNENSPSDLGYPAKGKYLAPEILYRMKHRSRISVRPCSDMWSIGVIVHLMLTKCYPFTSGTDNDDDDLYCNNVLGSQRVDYDDPHWMNISRTDTAKEFVGSLLHKSREKRNTAKGALQHEWLSDDFVVGESEPPRHPPRPYDTRYPQSRKTNQGAARPEVQKNDHYATRPTHAERHRIDRIQRDTRYTGVAKDKQHANSSTQRRDANMKEAPVRQRTFSFLSKLSGSRRGRKEDDRAQIEEEQRRRRREARKTTHAGQSEGTELSEDRVVFEGRRKRRPETKHAGRRHDVQRADASTESEESEPLNRHEAVYLRQRVNDWLATLPETFYADAAVQTQPTRDGKTSEKRTKQRLAFKVLPFRLGKKPKVDEDIEQQREPRQPRKLQKRNPKR